MAIDRFDLDSSMLSGGNYDPETKILNLTFARGGKTYTFETVPADVVEGLKNDPSPGRYFLDRIKGQFG